MTAPSTGQDAGILRRKNHMSSGKEHIFVIVTGALFFPLPLWETVIGGLRPPFLVGKNADASHRLWLRAHASNEPGEGSVSNASRTPHPAARSPRATTSCASC